MIGYEEAVALALRRELLTPVSIGLQRSGRGRMHRYEPGLAELRLADSQNAAAEIGIGAVKMQRLRNAKSRAGQ